MISFKVFNQRNGRLATLAALSVATLSQAFMPAFVSAAQIADRSVSLDSAATSATNVTYTISFDSVGAAGAYVVEFCNDTPLIGEACTAPTGMNAATAASATATAVTGAANKLTVTKTIGAAATITDTFTNISNPTVDGTVYARIVTYNNATNAGNYDDENLGTGNIDQGSAAFAITDSIGVSGDVLESLEFCVSGTAIANCADVAATTPTLTIGETTGSVKALASNAFSTGTVYTRLSTNASGGAVVNLKSGAISCGGLVLTSNGACNILPLTTATAAATVGADTTKTGFGVKLSGNVTDAVNGELRMLGSYEATNYYMNYVAGNATGVTSVYGDSVFDTNGTQTNDLSMDLTFGATIANNTPAGRYSADLSLIATGTF